MQERRRLQFSLDGQRRLLGRGGGGSIGAGIHAGCWGRQRCGWSWRWVWFEEQKPRVGSREQGVKWMEVKLRTGRARP